MLESANLNWNVPYDAKGKKEIQAKNRQAADEASAARAIYVALTRARDSLVLALPPLPKQEKDRPSTMYDLLRERTGFHQDASTIILKTASFAAHVKTYTKDIDFEEATAAPPETSRVFGKPTRPSAIPLTPWRSSPSTLKDAKKAPPKAEHFDYANALEKHTATLGAAERGTACHMAFRVMFSSPSAKDRLIAATPLCEAEIETIAHQARAMRDYLSEKGYTKFHLELPLQHKEESGAQINAIVDLLAVSEHGFAIVDHKTGKSSDLQASLAEYWPQLEAYQDLISKQWPDKPIKHVAINWMDEGKISLVTLPAMASVTS